MKRTITFTQASGVRSCSKGGREVDMEQEVQRFRMELLRKYPFYGDIVMRLPFVANSRIETARTNGYQIEYSPKFLEKLNQPQRRYVLMHEVLHVMLFHCSRRGDRDPELWNVAADLLVNSMLDQMERSMSNCQIRIERPPDGIFGCVNDSETVENVYQQLKNMNQGRKTGSPIKYTARVRRYYAEDAQTTARQDLVIGNADGEGGAGEEKSGPGIAGMVMDGFNEASAGLSEVMVGAILKEVVDKYRAELGSFYVPRGILRPRESKLLDWKRLLKNFLEDEISEESSYITPERKYIHMDLILPGYSKEEQRLEEVWAFVDSSGSIGTNELEQFLTQLSRICKQFKCTMNICYWDTEVTDVYKKVNDEKKVWESLPNHSGGTDINCVYRWLRKEKLRQPVMLILTDGYFGSLNDDFIPSLKNNTILVLNSGIRVSDEMRQIGKIAKL